MRTENAERLTIGEVAQSAGVASTTLRYYEREGLLSPADRSRAGYRLYDDGAVGRLKFIRTAQAVGFTLDDIRALLELNEDSSCVEVQALIQRRLAEVDGKLADLTRVRATLADALQRCRESKKGCAVVAALKRKSGKRISN